MDTFNEGAFLRRLATLVGVDDIMEGASLSAGSSASTIAIDTEITCPDATTLVMAAKTLKKAPGPLGLALGIKLTESPSVTIPEPKPPEPQGARFQHRRLPPAAAYQLPRPCPLVAPARARPGFCRGAREGLLRRHLSQAAPDRMPGRAWEGRQLVCTSAVGGRPRQCTRRRRQCAGSSSKTRPSAPCRRGWHRARERPPRDSPPGRCGGPS